MIKESYKRVMSAIKSRRWIRIAAICFTGAVVILATFQVGVSIGFKKAAFSERSGANFIRVFGGPASSPTFFAERLPGGHGAAGRVVSVSLPSFIVEGGDRVERIVETGFDTSIKRGQLVVGPSDLRAGSYVVVLGEPGGQGQIRAKVVRIMPSSPGFQPFR